MIPVLLFPQFDPVLVQLGPLSIRWYALAYITSLVIGWRLVRRFVRLAPAVATPLQVDDFLTWATLGVVLGGRLGYVLFYQPGVYLTHPAMILAVWEGGMSFHGGMLGVAIAIIVFCRRNGIPLLGFADRIAVVAPIGLGLGRVANFINGELWGRPAPDWLPWAMMFPRAPDCPAFRRLRARHPSQFYEALMEGRAAVRVMLVLSRREGVRARFGLLTGIFLCGYAMARITGEYFREPDAFLGFLAFGATMGQILSVPMLHRRVWLIVRARPAMVTGGVGGPPGAHDGASPERLDRFMARANAIYYGTHDPFADFTTSPEISQVFGEIIGLWAAVTWQLLGGPDPVSLVEAGPGRGTLMADALRAMRLAAPDFAAALRVHLIETSPRLRAAQAARLPDATWHDDLARRCRRSR